MVNELMQKIDLSQKGEKGILEARLHAKVYAASARDLSKEEEGQHCLHACI
jgi:hypothetical protein